MLHHYECKNHLIISHDFNVIAPFTAFLYQQSVLLIFTSPKCGLDIHFDKCYKKMPLRKSSLFHSYRIQCSLKLLQENIVLKGSLLVSCQHSAK